MRLLLPLSALMLAVAACGSSARHLRGPDGADDWVKIECRRNVGNCFERAAEECPNGYLVADPTRHNGFISVTSEQGSVLAAMFGNAKPRSTIPTQTTVAVPINDDEMVIECGSDQARQEAAKRGSVPRDVGPTGQPTPTKDLSRCASAFDHIDDMANLWLEWFPGEAWVELPGRNVFLALCGDTDDEIQLCLDAPYATAHRDQCVARIHALPPAARQRLHQIFVRDASDAP